MEGVRLFGYPWRYKKLANAPQCYMFYLVHGIRWTDEDCFTHEYVSNVHNTHLCDPANPHANASAGMVGENHPGPYLLPTRLSAQGSRNPVGTLLLRRSNMCL